MQPRRYIRQIRYVLCSVMVTATLSGTPLVHAATYYVATNGSDSRTCTQAKSQSTPKQTINNGRTCLAAGDTLSLMPGIYAESLTNPLPSGLSASQPTTLTGFSATNPPVLRPTSGNSFIILLNQARSNIRFRNLVIDARAYTGTLNSALATNNDIPITGLTIEDCEAIGRQGMATTGSGINIGVRTVATVRRCAIHGWDSLEANPGAHGIYWKGSHGLVEDNEIYDNNGWGIQFYRSCGVVNNNVFRNNVVSDGNVHGGLYIGSGSGNLAYNNLLVENTGSGIHVRGRMTKIFNNTIVHNGGRAMHISASQAEIRNNISYGNAQGIRNQSPDTTFSNNLCGTPGTGCQVIGDPRFVNAAEGDYSLRSDSPAIDQGVTLSAVKTDFDGKSRPQGSAYDIGAYEFD